MYKPCTNHSLIIGQLAAYGPCSIEGLIRYCLQQRVTTRAAAIEAISRIASRPEAVTDDGSLMVRGLGGC